MSRGTTPQAVPSETIIALHTQAHSFLRLALDSDDRLVQERYFDAAREMLVQMDVVTERARVENSAETNEDDSDPDAEHESDSEDFGDEGERNEEHEESAEADAEADEEGLGESEQDQQWDEGEDKGSGEEEWDINNGEDNSTPLTAENPFFTHYFINGPAIKPGLSAMKHTAAGKPVDFQPNLAPKNLAIRVYARMMELFEIESRHRMNLCNFEYASREKANRENLAKLNLSLVSEPSKRKIF
jgi:hypothetical protein